MSQTMKIRAGDTVEVRTGKDRGKRGRVIEALPKQGRVLVEWRRHARAHEHMITCSRGTKRSVTTDGAQCAAAASSVVARPTRLT